MPRTTWWWQMRLEKIYLPNFKNLQDFEVDFGTRIPPTTVLVGRNATGKV